MLIGVVGPCAAGKSTLIAELKKFGFQAKHIAQEHSYVPDMWQRLTKPDILIYLDVSYELTLVRRQMNWSQSEYDTQIQRLRHARQHADYYLSTDKLNTGQVLDNVLNFLELF